jgi:hypothetical protein
MRSIAGCDVDAEDPVDLLRASCDARLLDATEGDDDLIFGARVDFGLIARGDAMAGFIGQPPRSSHRSGRRVSRVWVKHSGSSNSFTRIV